jgi:drug/metabolite transporter (DMT)-like permease
MTSPERETRSTSASVKTHAALIVVQMAFASGAVEGKLAMLPLADGGGGVTPVALTMARMVGAAVFFQVLTGAIWRRTRVPTTAREQAALAGLALLGIVLNQSLFLIGLRLTSAFSAALLGVTIPVFTAALAILFRQERANARTALGLALAVAGVVWLIGIHAVDPGAIIIALNCLSYSFYIILSRRLIQRLGALTVITWLFTWGAILFAPFGARSLAEAAPGFTSRAWVLVAFVVLVPTIIAYVANAWALGRSSATLVTIYIYMQPLIAALLAWVQLGQGLSERMIVATALIFAGVTIVATRSTRAIARRAAS